MTLKAQYIKEKSMKKAVSYLYREILLEVWDYTLRNDRYKEYYQYNPELEEDINSLEVDIQKIIDIDFDEGFCEELYEEINGDKFLSDTISDVKSDLSDDAVETGVRDDDYEYPSKELAIPITGLSNYFIGFTHYFGGGRDGTADWEPDITETCYLLTCREEVRTVTVYEKVVEQE